jgi:hypothetical protein
VLELTHDPERAHVVLVVDNRGPSKALLLSAPGNIFGKDEKPRGRALKFFKCASHCLGIVLLVEVVEDAPVGREVVAAAHMDDNS